MTVRQTTTNQFPHDQAGTVPAFAEGAGKRLQCLSDIVCQRAPVCRAGLGVGPSSLYSPTGFPSGLSTGKSGATSETPGLLVARTDVGPSSLYPPAGFPSGLSTGKSEATIELLTFLLLQGPLRLPGHMTANNFLI